MVKIGQKYTKKFWRKFWDFLKKCDFIEENEDFLNFNSLFWNKNYGQICHISETIKN